ncbi:MAG: mechanosensitive ion channel [Verrucomicrobiae bacterium]|nr:mechanosensitive ion channel [Verrucomicrobiae bacterium]
MNSLLVPTSKWLDLCPAGIEIWRWLAFGASLVAAWILSRIVVWRAGKSLRKLTLKTKTDLDTKLVDLGVPIIQWAVLLFVARQGLHFLAFGPWMECLIVDLFKAAYAILIAVFGARMADVLLEIWGEKFNSSESGEQLKTSLLPAISRLLKIMISILTSLLILQNAGYNIGSLLAGLGIGGLAVALAAQHSLANIFGSITIFCDKPFIVGDRIKVDRYDGSVERIGLRSTVIRTLDGTVVNIPNRQMAEASIDNISRRPTIKRMFTLNLVYNTSLDGMREALTILRDILGRHPGVENHWVYWENFAPHSLDILVIYWSKHLKYQDFLIANEEINFEIKRRFEKALLEFAFPTQTICLSKTKPPAPIQGEHL